MNRTYDCIVAGGGPAGSTVAALLAEAGFTTLLLDRDKFPRFHAGESLMPETYWTLKRLGVLEALKASRFPKKYSLRFVSHTGDASHRFCFPDCNPHESSQTWQVLRAEFDELLWNNAQAKGADCRNQARVASVLFDNDRAYGVRVQSGETGSEEFHGRVIVDATGQQSLIAARLGLREQHPWLRKAALWGYYRGARRDTGLDEGSTLVLHTKGRRAWFWYVPLPDNVVSVGVVGDTDYLLQGRGKPATVFEEELVNCPAAAERLMDAQLEGPFRVARDFSYTARRAAGQGWLLVGDALAFVDPVFCSGVMLALKSGELAADAIIEGLREGDLSAQRLGRWAGPFCQAVDQIRKLVHAFYTDHFCFGAFVRQHPQHQATLTELLAGKLFGCDTSTLFEDMQPYLRCERELQD